MLDLLYSIDSRSSSPQKDQQHTREPQKALNRNLFILPVRLDLMILVSSSIQS
jgi:hypothetical protein